MPRQATKQTSVAASMAFQAPSANPEPADAFQGLPGPLLGLINFSCVDTTPGARCVMAPGPDQDLDQEGYRTLMRTRYRESPAHRQHMRVYARRIGYTPCTGPWADEARKILEAIGA